MTSDDYDWGDIVSEAIAEAIERETLEEMIEAHARLRFWLASSRVIEILA